MKNNVTFGTRQTVEAEVIILQLHILKFSYSGEWSLKEVVPKAFYYRRI